MSSSDPHSVRTAIYGATGYTGRLVARHAVTLGLQPTLAGRNEERVAKLASVLNCPSLTFPIRSASQLSDCLRGFSTVLNCAGPFSQTARPMMEACIAAKADYLDITGEIDVIECAASLSDRAKQAGVALIPAVGFDVVPSDCLAAMLAQRLPGAQRLELAFTTLGGMSPGTTKTMIEALPSGGRARIDGVIRRVPTAWKTMEVPFRHGKLMAMSIPWGDVASAYYSTGIPNIEVYTSVPPTQIARMRRMRFALPLLGIWPLKTLAMEWVERNVKGPSDEVRATARSSLWGRVTDASGNSVSATIETLSGYHLTALTAVAAMQLAIARQVPRGFSTASQAFGREFILSFLDTDIQWAAE
ncbi:saccharopine dehydrogenase NADP-binding domain-containing protein [Mesorhizobium sp. M0909]|uniref:saccharopine dehydrogenase family protein n=1 Tax=Mesorhizobium sp. M0909 TaxID=2957024 RepID=UPI003337CCE2